MRRKIKKNIKNMLQTMLEAHNHILLLLENKRIVEASNLLAQCQDCALYIGKTIEEKEAINIKAVSYLEAYCEQLYEISKVLDEKKLIKLKGQIDKSINYIQYELDEKISNDRLKIVFMPYKAAMWDCMESIWESANADKECEVFVVPIPYYERKEDGNLECLCYEGHLFPDYVPIVSYKEFSLDKEQPDVIYIHNPYDGANYVTSVHPDYYSSNLKKFTDKLIYIPYFLASNGPMPETHLNLPAYQYIDKIIVQDQEKAESLSEYLDEEKIVVMGSPKVDRIIKLAKRKKEIIEKQIPQQWKEKIIGKKVILFNVSLSGILQNSKYAIEKIRDIILKFEEQEAVVLLWRPHPLIEATLKSMRPQLHSEYMQIKNIFIKKGKGIFDETNDPGISVVISDAYLGENSSSIVNYFGVLGKPVLFIDWKIVGCEKRDRRFLSFSTFFQEKKSIFFIPINYGMGHDLYQLNLETGKLKRDFTFPGSPENIWEAYSGIKKVKNKLILIPFYAKNVYIYDIIKKQAVEIILSIECNGARFDEAVEYNDKLFLLPYCYPAIVSIDAQNYEVYEYKECVSPFLSKNKNIELFSLAYLKKGKFLYLASANESKILVFDMEEGNYTIKEIGKYPYGYGYLVDDGEYFWLAAYKKNSVVRWNEQSGDCKEYTYPIEKSRPEKLIWSSLFDKKDEIVVCDGSSLNISFINKKTGRCRNDKVVENMLAKVEMDTKAEEGGFASVNLLDEETVLLLEWKDCSIILWNMRTNHWKRFLCRQPVEEMLKTEKRQIEKYWISRMVPYSLSESSISILQYIDYIVEGEVDIFNNIYECYQTKEGFPVGFRIHEYISKLGG